MTGNICGVCGVLSLYQQRIFTDQNWLLHSSAYISNSDNDYNHAHNYNLASQ